MEIEILLETIMNNPGYCFVAGLITGYMLHVLVANGVASALRNKKPGRYQRLATPMTRDKVKEELAEPAFDWPDSAAKMVSPSQFGNTPLETVGK